MEAYVVEWLNFLVRWLHLIAGIAWIGSSFYFVWLDNHLEKPGPDANPRVFGEIWSVHGGGFYHNQKYLLGPEKLPATLHWFKWEAYTTFWSGLGLLAIVYWWGASTRLIDKSVADISVPVAIGISAGSLVLAWLVYDFLCKRIRNELVLGCVIFALVIAAAYGFSRVFGPQAAWLQTGAMVGTVMVWSVFFVIIPGQRKMVEAIQRGEKPDPAPGIAGKQRSVHNNYFTLPVLFIMISGHYPMFFGHRYAWLVLAVLSLAGVLIRHFFNLRHKGKFVPALPAAAIVLIIGLAWAIAPSAPSAPAPASGAASASPAELAAKMQTIATARCVSCHAAKPTYPGFATAPKDVVLDAPERLAQHAQKIWETTAATKFMPLGNLTGMTDEERAVVDAWYRSLKR